VPWVLGLSWWFVYLTRVNLGSGFGVSFLVRWCFFLFVVVGGFWVHNFFVGFVWVFGFLVWVAFGFAGWLSKLSQVVR
jgi:hypothetical protein